MRPAVLWRKGRFGTKSSIGARFAGAMLTVEATCRMHGMDLLAYLAGASITSMAGLAVSQLPPAPPDPRLPRTWRDRSLVARSHLTPVNGSGRTGQSWRQRRPMGGRRASLQARLAGTRLANRSKPSAKYNLFMPPRFPVTPYRRQLLRSIQRRNRCTRDRHICIFIVFFTSTLYFYLLILEESRF